MAAEDVDFATYCQARWHDLVTALEHEGVTGSTARMAVAHELGERRRGWARLVRNEDVDRHLWAAIRERVGLPPAAGAVPLSNAPQAEFDRPEPWLARAEERMRWGRRLRRRRVLRAAVVAVVLAGVSGWWLSRPEPPPVRDAANPLPVPWYADGELHLDRVVVGLPAVAAFEQSAAGVAVRLENGSTRLVSADGEVEDWDTAAPITSDQEVDPGFSAADFEVLDQIETADGVVVRVVLYRKGWDELVTDRYVAIVCERDVCREHTLEVEGRVRFS